MQIPNVKRFDDACTLLRNHNIGWTHTLQYAVLTRAEFQANYFSPINHFMDGEVTQVAAWNDTSYLLQIFETPSTWAQSTLKNYITILNTERL